MIFDEVVHYQIGHDEIKYLSIKDKITENSIIAHKFIYSWDENTVLDTDVESKLHLTPYVKHDIDTSKYSELREIFKESKVELESVYACDPTFRDILVFKKKKHVIGVAKICLECSKSQFIGTTAKVLNFGSNGEFEKLNKILNEAQKMN